MSKKALLVLDSFAGGGAQRSMAKYIVELSRSGYEITAITLDRKVDFALPEGVKWLYLPQNTPKIPFMQRRIQARQLRQIINSEGGLDSFDIRVSTMLRADKVVSALGDSGFIFRFASDYNATLHRNKHIEIFQKVKLYSFRKVYKKYKILCVSNELVAGAKALLGRSDERIVSIYNPFDFDRIRNLMTANDPDIPEEPYLVHVGRPSRQKRLDLLIEAFKRSGVPHKLVLVGRPSERAQALVKEASIEDRVIFAGYKENPYPLIARAEALVLSSDYEGLPNVLVESLICGTPVVSTRCNYGPSEILTGPQARFLVEPGDVEGLSRAVRLVLSEPPDLTRVDLEKFRPDGFVRKLEEFAAMK